MLELPGLPPHNLQLKIGSQIIMLWNLKQPRPCSVTRLAMKKLINNVIKVIILNRKYECEDVLIERISLIQNGMPFEFKRLLFPVRLAFSMSINKSQGKSLNVCGINLENPYLSNGQLYDACSRDEIPTKPFIYAPEKKEECCNIIKS